MKGFTLVESLIAVTIVTVAVVGPLVTANRSIVTARIVRDQLTASYLAQEGIEYVRAIRDNAYLAAYQAGGVNISSTAWADFSSTIVNCRTSVLGNAPFCTYDPAGSGSLAVCSGTCGRLWLSASNIYTQVAAGTQTPFTRTVQTVSVNGGDEKVVSKVSWSYHGTPYVITISAHLTPWQ